MLQVFRQMVVLFISGQLDDRADVQDQAHLSISQDRAAGDAGRSCFVSVRLVPYARTRAVVQALGLGPRGGAYARLRDAADGPGGAGDRGVPFDYGQDAAF